MDIFPALCSSSSLYFENETTEKEAFHFLSLFLKVTSSGCPKFLSVLFEEDESFC